MKIRCSKGKLDVEKEMLGVEIDMFGVVKEI